MDSWSITYQAFIPLAGISDPHVTEIIRRIDSKDWYVITRAAKCGSYHFLFFGHNKVEVTVFIGGNTFYDFNQFQLMKEVGKIIFIFVFIWRFLLEFLL